MKRILLSFVAVLIITAFILPDGWAAGRVLYSAAKSADALITTGAAYFNGIAITGDGTNVITADIHNGLTTAGEKIAPTLHCIQSAAVKTCAFEIDPPVYSGTGIYVNITTSGTIEYTVYYSK
jgi:hypothetical protein